MPHVDLLELPYFEGISLDSVVALVDLMEPKHFPANTTIVREGDSLPPPLYIATAGCIVMSKRSAEDGTDRDLAELKSPTLFGEVELFCQIAPIATARSVTPVSLFALTRATFDRLFEARHPALLVFTFNVARVACHRLAIADEMLATRYAGKELVDARNAFTRLATNSSCSRVTDTPHKT